MRRELVTAALGAVCAVLAAPAASGKEAPASSYKIVQTAKVGGEGAFDYVYADVDHRKLYIPRRPAGAEGHVQVFDLDTLAPAGDIASGNARGVAVDPKSNHAFSSGKPVAMWDARTLQMIKTIPVEGNPDGIFFDPFNARVYVFSHVAPYATVIDAASGAVLGTIDLGGQPEQAVSDGKGYLYVDLEDKKQIAVVDAKTMKVLAHHALGEDSGAPAGLAFDVKNGILFAAGSAGPKPGTMVILKASDGKILTTLPIGSGVDGAVFNAATGEAFSSQRDGTLTIIKEQSPAKFAVAQTVSTMFSAKTLTLDRKTGRILLIGAEYGEANPPTLPDGRAAPRPMVPGSFTILSVGK